MKFFKKKTVVGLAIFLMFVLGYLCLLFAPKPQPLIFGTSFDADYARYLGLDPAASLQKLFTDYHFRFIRLSAHWQSAEPTSGTFDFTELDHFFAEAQKHDAKITLALGQKTPRWPECHLPPWATALPKEEYRRALKKYIAKVVLHYRSHPALEYWQVENEPFLPFGPCATLSKAELLEEIALVKQLDPDHPIIVGDSGELATWQTTARAGDLFGTTLYRVVWNKFTGYWNYDWLPAAFYQAKLKLAGRSPSDAYVLELQAEPWINGNLLSTPLAEQSRSMNLARLQKNISFAQKVGFPRAYLWGAEWWLWLDQTGHPEIPRYIVELVK